MTDLLENSDSMRTVSRCVPKQENASPATSPMSVTLKVKDVYTL